MECIDCVNAVSSQTIHSKISPRMASLRWIQCHSVFNFFISCKITGSVKSLQLFILEEPKIYFGAS